MGLGLHIKNRDYQSWPGTFVNNTVIKLNWDQAQF